MAKKQTKKETKKQTKKDKIDKSKNLISLLKKHGAQVYEDLENGEFPKFSIPNRSISNIIYDKKLRQYVLGTNTSPVAESKDTLIPFCLRDSTTLDLSASDNDEKSVVLEGSLREINNIIPINVTIKANAVGSALLAAGSFNILLISVIAFEVFLIKLLFPSVTFETVVSAMLIPFSQNFIPAYS